ncbi:Hypp8643 [Branchiostoma lanceolatum]|uniref:Hypp8643 protein n=1 Tax=Branchiostoma lanceolatum TaxID=7740 RepID=A0A8J9Z829_BRALA|nr:Hypp8643 [Branchiostoma lanceolatum]
MTSCAYFATLVTWSFGWMASGNNVLTVYVEGGEEGQEDTEEKDKKDDTKAEEKNEGDSVSLEVVSEDEEEVEKEEEEEGKRTAKQNGTIVAMVVLKVFGLAFFINYLVNVAGKEAHDSCSVPGEKRQACGSWSTSERECVDMGCCYRSPFSVPNAPWCYHKASEEDTNNWFVGSLAGEDSSEETDPDKDTTSDLGAVFDWLLNTDQPSGDEEHMKETDPTPHAKHDAKPPHPDSRPKAASGHHPPPAHTRPPHHKEPKQETPVDCHHNVMCRLSEWEAGHKVINGLPADPTVRHLLEAVAWLMMIGALCMIFCFCYLFRRVEPPKEEEGKESDAPGDEKGPPATFDVETEMDGKEKLPPVAFVEAGDYSDPWSDRDDVVINPAELKALMAKLQEEENTING